MDEVYDAFFGKYMAITTDAVPPGKVGVPYRWEVYAEVKNEPYDNLYDYDFKLSRGHLPAGLSFSDAGDFAVIQGVPSIAGEFPIVVRVFSDRLWQEENWEDDSHVWSSSDSESFTIRIEPSRMLEE